MHGELLTETGATGFSDTHLCDDIIEKKKFLTARKYFLIEHLLCMKMILESTKSLLRCL